MSTAWERLANEPILDLAPYEPGKPVEELERELGIAGAIKLASNENPLPPSPAVLAAIRQVLGGLNRYPDGSGFYLRQALAKRHGVAPDAILLGNGSNELLELLARTFVRQGEEVVFPHPSFIVYPSIVQSVGGIRVVVTLKDHRLDLATMARAITPLTKLVFIANPNNPTGTVVTADEVEKFLAEVPERVIVVFDEAYYEFAQGEDFPDSVGCLRQGRRVVVLRTFSKVSSLAGLRVGYAIADPDCIALVNRIRQPFNVNTLAQVAALAALEDEAHARTTVAMIQDGIKTLYRALDELGVRYVPTRANFVYVEVADAGRVYQQLLRAGVIVRPLGAFGVERALRITVGTPEENARLVEALRSVLGKKRGRA
ncbi:MAG: histidinol-phosphate transaminase [Candidatus Rokuibacteriota bacterium]